MYVEDFVLRIKCSNNVKMIIRISPEDSMSNLIHKIKQSYTFQHSRIIEMGGISDDKGYDIVEDIRIGSIFNSGDVLLATIREVKAITTNFTSNVGNLNFDFNGKYHGNCSEIIEEQVVPAKTTSVESVIVKPTTPKTVNKPISIKPPVVESKNEQVEIENKPIEAKPKRKRTVKPKGDQPSTSQDVKKSKPIEVKNKQEEIENDPFNIFKDVKEEVKETNKTAPIPKAVEIEKKDMKGLKKKTKVDYNAL